MITYVDTSVLLRIVLGEDGPLEGWDQIDPVSSDLIRVEALRAVERYRLLNALDDELVAERRAAILDILGRFTMSSITPSILERAGDPFPTALATLDAIHLATALVLRDEFPGAVFATHDQKLATGARALGFVVEGA